MTAIIHISFQKAYQYKGWLFEWDRNKPFEPWPLKEDRTEKKKAGERFYAMFSEFNLLSKEEQETYRV